MKIDTVNHYIEVVFSKYILILASGLLLTLAGCPYNDDSSSDTPITSYTVTASAEKTTIAVGSTTTVSVLLEDQEQQPVSGNIITFTVDNGSFGSQTTTSAVTDADGIATATLTAPTSVGIGTVIASHGDSTAPVVLTYIADAIATLTLDAIPSTVGIGSITTLVAQARDQYGNPVPLSFLQFSTDSDTATIDNGVLTITNSNGAVIINYTSGNTTGKETITVQELNNPTVQATTIIDVVPSAIAAANLTVNGGAGWVDITVGGNTLEVSAAVTDSSGNAIPGIEVLFQLKGAGNISGAKLVNVTTDENGNASTTLSSAESAEDAIFTAYTSGLYDTISVCYHATTPIEVTFTASPVPVTTSSYTTLIATFYDEYGNATPNEPVYFDIITNTSNGTLGNLTGITTTNTDGVAAMRYYTGSATGTDVIQVTANNGAQPSAAVEVPVTQATATIDLSLGPLASSIVVGTDATVTATLLDNNGHGIAGAELTFLTGDGHFDGGAQYAVITTDADGMAQITLTAPTVAGSETIMALSLGATSILPVTYLPSAPYLITVQASPSVVDALTDSTISAYLLDQYGNAISNQTVLFSFPIIVNSGDPGNYSGATFTDPIGYSGPTSIIVTNQYGNATITYTSGNTTGVVDTIAVTAESGSNPSSQIDISVISP